MRTTFLFLLSVSLASYGQKIHLTEEEAQIHQVSKDTVIHIDPLPIDYLIIVENQDLDTYGSITLKDQAIHSASWMGPYGNYLIYIPGDAGEVKIQVKPLESSVESTPVKLTLLPLKDKSAHFIQAIQNYTHANDLRIKQYLGHSNQTQKAIGYFTSAAEGFEQEQAGFYLALSLFEKGKALIEVGAHIEGLEDLKKATDHWSLNHKNQYLRAANFLGLAYWNTGQLNKALLEFEKVINAYTNDLNSLVLAQAINNSGLINLELGEFTVAKKLFSQSLETNGMTVNLETASTHSVVSAINNSDDVKNTAATLNNLALVYDALGEPEVAEQIWLAYIEVSKNVSNRTTRAKAENNLAMHYLRKGHFEQAQKFLQSAKKTFENNTSSRWLSLVHHNLGFLYYELGMMHLAEIQLKKALQLRNEINHPKGRMESISRLASIYRKQGKLNLSLQLSKELLSLADKAEDNQFKALSHLNLYHILKLQDDLTGAAHHIDMAIQHIQNTPFKRLSSRINITKAEQLIQDKQYTIAIQVLQNEVKTLEKIWNTRLLNSANNLLARAHYLNQDYQAAQHVIQDELKNIKFYLNNTISSKITTNLNGLLKESLHINALILDKLGQAEQGFLQTAQLTNQLKSQQAETQSNGSSAHKTITEWLNAIEYKSVALENQKLSNHEKEQLEDEIIELKARIDFSYQRAKVERPETIRLKDIQNKLGADTLLIVYSIGDTDGLSWWLSRDQFISQKVADRNILNKLIAASRNELNGHNKTYHHTRQLSELLTESLAKFKAITEIKIITDEPLNLVPFGALNDARREQPTPIAATSGVQRLMTIDALQNSRQTLESDAKALIIADPVNSTADNRLAGEMVNAADLMPYPRLKNTQIETNIIQSKLNADAITGFEANKDQFLATNFEPYRLLHIASHAFFHPEIAGLSSLVLSTYTANGGLQESAYVRALDISQLSHDLDLTVLSGCETGIGDSNDALGLTGLTQSFLLAGSNNVVSSLWQVDDQASSKFMAYFYTNLVNNMAIDQAFWSAQKSMLENPRTRHPKYWAGWFLVTK